MTALDKWLTDARTIVESLGTTLGPDDDWMPVCFLLTGDEMVVAAIDPEFMSSNATKNRLGDVILPGLVRKTNADAFAMVMTIWQTKISQDNAYDQAKLDPETGLPRVPVSLMPDRVEAVLVTAVTKEGANASVAEITRSPDKAPELGAWDTVNVAFSGRMIDGVKAAFGHTNPPPDIGGLFK